MAARASFLAALETLEPLARERGDDERLAVALGYAYAGLGRSAEARASAALATQSRQVSASPVPAPKASESAASILAQANLAGEAVQMLERLLVMGSPVNLWLLRLDPLYDPIRRHAAFQSLLSSYTDPCEGR